MSTQPDPNARVIAPEFDKRGKPLWRSRMTPPDNTYALCWMVPDRIIPVIFVPGVMGSNLRARGSAQDASATRWRMDSGGTAFPWSTPKRGAKYRRRWLNPAAMEVDDQGALPDHPELPQEERRRRGWGEVGHLSYGTFLPWLETALNDFNAAEKGERVRLMELGLDAELGEALLTRDEVNLSYKYRFAVYACGYNWLDDNAKSAEQLSKRINEIRERYKADKMRCDKVIIVTHSMGGLVARHCSEVLKRSSDIFGIVHGVMPAIGAAAVYRRMKAGTEDYSGWYNAVGYVGASVMGNDAAEVTAALSQSPGPLQLLPTPEYGNGWLKVRDGAQEHSLPKAGDPYGEIYLEREKWWGMVEDHLINPLNEETDAVKRRARVDVDWKAYAKIVAESVRPFHAKIAGKYHPNTYAFFGSSDDHRAFGTVTWSRTNTRIWAAPGDVMAGRLANPGHTDDAREVTLKAPVAASSRAGPHAPARAEEVTRTYQLARPDEAGDGTVPHRSGAAPKAHCKGLLQVNVEHEPCYKWGEGDEQLRACLFTVRSIVKLAQAVKDTSLRYAD